MRPGNRKGREDVREGSKDDEEQKKKKGTATAASKR